MLNVGFPLYMAFRRSDAEEGFCLSENAEFISLLRLFQLDGCNQMQLSQRVVSQDAQAR